MTNSPSASETSSRRQSIIDGLSYLENLTKAQASFIRHCLDAEELSTDSRQSLRNLLDSMVEHRRRLRNCKRAWMTLGTSEPQTPGLESHTATLLRENDTLITALEPWRKLSLLGEQSALQEMWRRLSTSAAYFTGDSTVTAET